MGRWRDRAMMARAGGEGILAVVACTVASGYLPANEHLATVASLYVSVILITTLRGGIWPGILAAVLSYFLLDYEFLPPVPALDPSWVEWIEFIVFIGSAVLVGRLVDRVRVEAVEARRRDWVVRLVAGMLHALGEADRLDDVLTNTLVWAIRELSLAECAIFLPIPGDRMALAAQLPHTPDWNTVDLARARDAHRYMTVIRIDDAVKRQVYVPLLSRGKGVGVLGTKLGSSSTSLIDDESMQVALTHHVGVAIEQARLRAEATEAEVLRRSDELKSTLLSLVSHDLRTPLTVIKMASEALQHDRVIRDAPGAEPLLAAIGQESDRLQHFVGNLLDLSRVDGGALRLALGWYELGELTREAVDHLRPSCGDHEVEVTSADDLPPIQVDYVLVDRVIANLVLNALRYSPATTPIRVRVDRFDRELHVVVSDEGPGVLDGELNRIFERFYQCTGTRTGVGLGLALCKAIVEAHGGRIWAEPGPHGGPGLIVTASFPIGSAALHRSIVESRELVST